MKPIITAREAAELIGVHVDTVYDSANKGEIPCRKIGYDTRIFSPREIEQNQEGGCEVSYICKHCHGRSAICPTCDKLLTWSEPDPNGDIRAGNYIIRICTMSVTGVTTTIYRAMTYGTRNGAATPLSRHVNLEAAKLACENHARKMLGWDV